MLVISRKSAGTRSVAEHNDLPNRSKSSAKSNKCQKGKKKFHLEYQQLLKRKRQEEYEERLFIIYGIIMILRIETIL